MAHVIKALRRAATALEAWHQSWCRHRAMRYVSDAWDFEYICRSCDRRWFNEVPPNAAEATK